MRRHENKKLPASIFQNETIDEYLQLVHSKVDKIAGFDSGTATLGLHGGGEPCAKANHHSGGRHGACR